MYAYMDKYGILHGPVSKPKSRSSWPLIEVGANYDPQLERRSGPVLSLDGDVVTATYTVTPIPLLELQEAKCKEVDAKRDQLIAAGVPYEFNGIPGTVQTRSLEDHRNIQANASAAQMYLMAGHPDAPMQFRDMENVVHSLTAQQMLDMCAYVMGHGQGLYATSWALKDAIRALDAAAVLAYDTQEGW